MNGNVSFNDKVGAILGVIALVAVGYMALFKSDEQALGALILVVGSASAWFLRGRVQPPTP